MSIVTQTELQRDTLRFFPAKTKSSTGPSKMTYVYNGIRVKWSRIKWYTRSICTLLYINFDGLYIIMNSPYRSLCTKFIIYAIILYDYQIVRRSFFMAPFKPLSWYSWCKRPYFTKNQVGLRRFPRPSIVTSLWIVFMTRTLIDFWTKKSARRHY